MHLLTAPPLLYLVQKKPEHMSIPLIHTPQQQTLSSISLVSILKKCDYFISASYHIYKYIILLVT